MSNEDSFIFFSYIAYLPADGSDVVSGSGSDFGCGEAFSCECCTFFNGADAVLLSLL